MASRTSHEPPLRPARPPRRHLLLPVLQLRRGPRVARLDRDGRRVPQGGHVMTSQPRATVRPCRHVLVSAHTRQVVASTPCPARLWVAVVAGKEATAHTLPAAYDLAVTMLRASSPVERAS